MRLVQTFLFASGFATACGSPLFVTIQPFEEEAVHPRVTLEFIVTAGDESVSVVIEDEPIPVREKLLQPDGFAEQDRVIELRVLNEAGREIGRQTGFLNANQNETSLLVEVCGNGAATGGVSENGVEFGEQCDDGNFADGDGCDSTCEPTGCDSGVATPGELCFDRSEDLLGPTVPLQVVSGNFNGDELPDLAVPYPSLVGFTLDNVQLFFGTQDGFGIGEVSFIGDTQGDELQRIAAGDIDGDGVLDLVALLGSTVLVLANDGLGKLSASPSVPLGVPSAMALVDIDGNEAPELLFTSGATLGVRSVSVGGVAPNNAQLLPLGVEPVAFAVADLDRDGDKDVITANTTGSISLLENDGGVLSVQPSSLLFGGFPSSVVVSDLTGDGILDVAVAMENNNEGFLAVLVGEKTPFAFSAVARFEAAKTPSALIASDLDLDGDIDLAVTSESDSVIVVQLNDGASQFAPPQDEVGGVFPTEQNPGSLIVEDLNRDGVPDLVAAGENLGVLLSNP